MSNGTENRLKHRLSAAARSWRCKHRTSWRGPLHTFPRPARVRLTVLARVELPRGRTALPFLAASLPARSCSVFGKVLAKGLGSRRSNIDEFVSAVQELYPTCCIQWEDFANFNAVAILERYRDKVCTFNDDIQGTAGIALAGIYGGLRISKPCAVWRPNICPRARQQRLHFSRSWHGNIGNSGETRDGSHVHRCRQSCRRASHAGAVGHRINLSSSKEIFEASIHVAAKVAERIFENNLAGIPRPADRALVALRARVSATSEGEAVEPALMI